MSGMVNINREVEDSFYRYKMPLIQIKVEGRGNGIKTAIPNMVEVAKSLGRPPAYPTKYLGVELGAQTQMYADQERYIVNGNHEASRFQDLLDGFIKKFVLCEACGNPETVLRVTSKKQIESSCRACGYRCNLPLTHRLTTYIINNPPNGDNKKGKGKKDKKKKGKEEEEGDTDQSSSGVMTGGGQQSQAQQREAGGRIDAPDRVVENDDDDDDWGEDATEEAARERAKELGGGVSALTQTNDLEKPMAERLELFHSFVAQRLNLPKFPAQEVISEADRLECKEKGVMILVQALWMGDDVLGKMKKYQGIFQRFTFDNPKAQKSLLAAIEKLIESQPESLAKTAHILKNCYDLDLVDEDAFIKWAAKPSKNVDKALADQIQAKAKPFIDWIKEADEESSGDDDDVGFGEAEPEPVAKEESKEEEEEEEEEDIDIDDI